MSDCHSLPEEVAGPEPAPEADVLVLAPVNDLSPVSPGPSLPPTSQYLVPVNLTQNVSQILPALLVRRYLTTHFRALPAELKHVTITTYVAK